MYDRSQLVNVLSNMKEEYESEIKDPEGHPNYLIRSQSLIQKLHEYVKEQLVDNGIDREHINEERKIYGYPKVKSQDIMVQDLDSNKSTGPLLSINIRSQLSSIEKNYDTLYERLFAEAINLHNRFPYLPLGYLYLLPKLGYDSDAKKENEIVRNESYNYQKYIDSFTSMTNRKSPQDAPWKYEAVCLLIVDFSQDPPVIMDDIEQFIDEGMVTEEFAKVFNFKPLSIENFFNKMIYLYKRRNTQTVNFEATSEDLETKNNQENLM